ncbi:hypothetical protein I7I48_00391 [Histoplasma ohiense]|nr:hypothetical protein I7I48_00391 [Histoplasma ohiense (nom. inval.)]
MASIFADVHVSSHKYIVSQMTRLSDILILREQYIYFHTSKPHVNLLTSNETILANDPKSSFVLTAQTPLIFSSKTPVGRCGHHRCANLSLWHHFRMQ